MTPVIIADAPIREKTMFPVIVVMALERMVRHRFRWQASKEDYHDRLLTDILNHVVWRFLESVIKRVVKAWYHSIAQFHQSICDRRDVHQHAKNRHGKTSAHASISRR